MPMFSYEGRNKTGTKVHGKIDAANIGKVTDLLHERGVVPLDIKAAKSSQHNTIIGIGEKLRSFMTPKVKVIEVLNFSRQMEVLISAGVPIVKSVKQLALTSHSEMMRKVLAGVVSSLESGKNLTASLGAYPQVFSAIFISLIRVGENIGHLEEIFSLLTSFLEAQIENRKRLIAAIRYPLIVISTMFIGIMIMNIFVIPKFARLFLSFNVRLPLPTRMLISLSQFTHHYWYIILLVLLAGFVGLKLLLRMQPIHLFWDKHKLRIPVLGLLQQRIILTQFSKTMGMILHSGVPILKGLALAAEATGNLYLASRILLIHDAIDRGETFSSAAGKVSIFEPTMLQMIEIGEETGKLDDMLNKIATVYEKEIDYEIKNLNDVFEPMLLIVVGALVAFLAISVYLPMWDMVKFVNLSG
jgi:MSHA biogenesis protein MshG